MLFICWHASFLRCAFFGVCSLVYFPLFVSTPSTPEHSARARSRGSPFCFLGMVIIGFLLPQIRLPRRKVAKKERERKVGRRRRRSEIPSAHAHKYPTITLPNHLSVHTPPHLTHTPQCTRDSTHTHYLHHKPCPHHATRFRFTHFLSF